MIMSYVISKQKKTKKVKKQKKCMDRKSHFVTPIKIIGKDSLLV